MSGRIRRGERGQGGIVVLVLGLLVVGLLTAILVGTTLDKGGQNGTAGNPTVGLAADTQAKSSLSQAVTAAQQALAAGGGISAAALATANPGLEYTPGPSTGPGVISVAAAAGAGTGGVSVPGAPATGSSGAALAVRSTSGNCWFAYLDGAVPWYGEQTGQASCSAPPLSGAPSPGPVSSSAIGWQAGSFPAP